MSLIFFQSLIIAVFSFGTAIFYALSCIERPVINLWLNQRKVIGNHDIIRFIHNELKKLIPLLPPSNGFVIAIGTISMIFQCVLTNWSFFSIVIITFYWLSMLFIIFIGKINEAINDVKNTNSNDNIVNVKRGLSKLIKLHHQGLFANLFTVILQIIFTTIN